jgi:hypothetical protein
MRLRPRSHVEGALTVNSGFVSLMKRTPILKKCLVRWPDRVKPETLNVQPFRNRKAWGQSREIKRYHGRAVPGFRRRTAPPVEVEAATWFPRGRVRSALPVVMDAAAPEKHPKLKRRNR